MIEIFGVPYIKKGSGIHIKKKNRGSFTKYCKGKVTQNCIDKAKKSGNSKLVKKAVFAENSRKWKHQKGGVFKYQAGTPEGGINYYVNGEAPDPNLYYHPDIASVNPVVAEINRKHDAEKAHYDYAPNRIPGFSNNQHQKILRARQHLIDKGLTDNQIYALFGNIMKESSFNPSAVQKGGDKAVGYFQMHGDRLNDYNKWRRVQTKLSEFPEIDYFLEKITSGNDIYTNGYNESKQNVENTYNILQDAIKNGSGITNATAEYNKAKKYHNETYGARERSNSLYLIDNFQKVWNDPNSTTEQLTDLFEKTFEKAGTPETEKRVNYATMFQQHYTPQTMKKGAKLHKPFGHRSVLDNGWIPTKRLKKGTYGLIKKK